jgi:predicted transcriptional regulator
MKHTSDTSIKEAAPHIFTRPFLSVESNTPMPQIITFLAIGSQIYVDGLVVISENEKGQRIRPVGRIGCKHIFSNLLESDYLHWLEMKASQIMDNTVGALEMDSNLSSVLEIFNKTRFGFVPIVANKDEERGKKEETNSNSLKATLTIRDILPLIAKANITAPIKQISSILVSVDGKTSITDVLGYMMHNGIRNMGINDDASIHEGGKSRLLRIINDRKILEFLFSHKGRNILNKYGNAGLGNINIINHLDVISVAPIKSDTTVSKAAELLMDIRTPCLVSEDDTNYYILTPWDIVMKTLRSESTPIIADYIVRF